MTCGPADIACRLDEIVRTLNDSSPTPEDWVGWALTVLGIAASTFVAVAALRSSNRALKIAKNNDDREAKRDADLDRDRVDRWLAEFLVNATDYRVACDDWKQQTDVIEDDAFRAGYSGNPDDLPQAPRPSTGPMLARLDAARLVARGAESDDIARFADHVQYVRKQPMYQRSGLVQDAIVAMRKWRSAGDSAALDVLRRLPDEEHGT